MEISDDQPKTPAACDIASILCNAEDSGYHTPFTSSLSDSGQLNTSSLKRFIIRRNPNSNNRRRFVRSNAIVGSDSYEDPVSSLGRAPIFSPFGGETSNELSLCRPLKRSLDQSEDRILSLGIASTPTSAITGDLEKLHMQSPLPASDFFTSDYFSLSSIGETSKPLSYPTTPVKSSKCKIAKLSPKCERKSTSKRSPSKEYKENIYPKRSAKKLSYDRDQTPKEPPKVEYKPRSIIPDKKIDIVSKLQEMRVPAIETILSYLDSSDLYNFSEVSPIWRHICNSDKRAKNLRDNYAAFIAETKENYSCSKKYRDNDLLAQRVSGDGEKLKLRCMYNFTNSLQASHTIDRTPPGTPRTNKLRKFVKCGSLDGRTQLACVRCCHPAKVTVEPTGEQWAQCLGFSCSFAFCRFCKCEHHPGKTCLSLDAPSPTKRRKQSTEKHFDSKKCRRNLRRLMEH